ncbi:MAG: hypothetical protein LLF86_06245 [Nitrospiraceae bacterium]|nr:hypothetical protein [Nitrospiraceae bacterium]
MRKFSIAAVLICLALLVVSCGKKEVKKTTIDSKLATESFAVAEALRSAYVNRQIAVMENHTTKNGFKNITSVLKTFDAVELTFTPVWVDIQGDKVQLNVSWKGKWTSAGNITEERGMAVFELKGTPLKVDAVLRANPFRYPE